MVMHFGPTHSDLDAHAVVSRAARTGELIFVRCDGPVETPTEHALKLACVDLGHRWVMHSSTEDVTVWLVRPVEVPTVLAVPGSVRGIGWAMWWAFGVAVAGFVALAVWA